MRCGVERKRQQGGHVINADWKACWIAFLFSVSVALFLAPAETNKHRPPLVHLQ
jgi:hypothetical protein